MLWLGLKYSPARIRVAILSSCAAYTSLVQRVNTLMHWPSQLLLRLYQRQRKVIAKGLPGPNVSLFHTRIVSRVTFLRRWGWTRWSPWWVISPKTTSASCSLASLIMLMILTADDSAKTAPRLSRKVVTCNMVSCFETLRPTLWPLACQLLRKFRSVQSLVR